MSTFKPTKEFYLAHQGWTFRVGRTARAMVTKHRTTSQAGTWERGFKFGESEWAMLKRVRKVSKHYQPTEYSMDHGKTWHASPKAAKAATKGKLRLNSSTHGELAFEGIQRINREYDPSYKWRP